MGYHCMIIGQGSKYRIGEQTQVNAPLPYGRGFKAEANPCIPRAKIFVAALTSRLREREQTGQWKILSDNLSLCLLPQPLHV